MQHMASPSRIARHPYIGAVVTDLVMAGGGGRELEQALHARRPELPIVLATGGLPDYEKRSFAAVLAGEALLGRRAPAERPCGSRPRVSGAASSPSPQE